MTVFFMHIPKTAGTTLRMLLAQQYDWEAIWPVPVGKIQGPREYPIQKVDNQAALYHSVCPDDIRPYDLVMGHIDFTFMSRMPFLNGFTILRDPVRQLFSHFQFITRPGSRSELYPLLAGMSFEDMLDSDHTRHFQNRQAMFVAGTYWTGQQISREIVSRAKANLRRFDSVGFVECYDESIAKLEARFGWQFPRPLPWYNMGNRRRTVEDLDPATVQKARQVQRFDVELYEYAREVYG